MTGLWAVYRREMLSLWVTPLAWLLLFVFLLLQGVSFYIVIDHFAHFTSLSIDQGVVQGYFSSLFIPFSLLLVCPALTMGLFAEERRSGTLETLLTAPVSAAAVVHAKYLAALSTYSLLWLPTLLYVVIVRNVAEVDWAVVAASYAGLLAVGAAYLSIGLLMSALTRSQLAALMLTTLVLFGLFILGVGERVFDPGLLRDVCGHVSVLAQLEDFSRGVIDLRRLVFDSSVASLCLFMTRRVVDSWRWG
jgi:gliding motility-associated transport system permease protein